MKFYIVKNNEGKFRYDEKNVDINDFSDNKIFDGVSKIKEDLFITEKLLEKIMNGNDYFEGINLDWTSAQEFIAAHFNQEALKGEDMGALTNFSTVPTNESVKVLEFKVPSNSFGHKERIHYSDELAKKLIYKTITDYVPHPLHD